MTGPRLRVDAQVHAAATRTMQQAASLDAAIEGLLRLHPDGRELLQARKSIREAFGLLLAYRTRLEIADSSQTHNQH